VPEALVTPWIPETPVPTATPEPTPEPEAATPELNVPAVVEETVAPEDSAANEPVGPVSYIVVAVLFVILIVLITVSIIKRRRLSGTDLQENNHSRKDS
jgi:hypothetical protein